MLGDNPSPVKLARDSSSSSALNTINEGSEYGSDGSARQSTSNAPASTPQPNLPGDAPGSPQQGELEGPVAELAESDAELLRGVIEDEAAAKIAAGMKGMVTRKELKAGNIDRYTDADRETKIEARKKRIVEGTATEEDQAIEQAVCSMSTQL